MRIIGGAISFVLCLLMGALLGLPNVEVAKVAETLKPSSGNVAQPTTVCVSSFPTVAASDDVGESLQRLIRRDQAHYQRNPLDSPEGYCAAIKRSLSDNHKQLSQYGWSNNALNRLVAVNYVYRANAYQEIASEKDDPGMREVWRSSSEDDRNRAKEWSENKRSCVP